MEKEELRSEIAQRVDEAINDGLSEHAAEDLLQSEAQNIREERRVYRVFVYECPEASCEETSTQLIDQIDLQCDVCGDGNKVHLVHSTVYDNVERMEFHCNDHPTVRVQDISIGETTCSIHNTRMDLIESYSTEEGLGE